MPAISSGDKTGWTGVRVVRVDWQQFDGSYPQIHQVRDFLDQSEIGPWLFDAARGVRREAADVRFTIGDTAEHQ